MVVWGPALWGGCLLRLFAEGRFCSFAMGMGSGEAELRMPICFRLLQGLELPQAGLWARELEPPFVSSQAMLLSPGCATPSAAVP